MATRYDYYEAVSNDIRNYIEQNNIKVYTSNRVEIQERLQDDLWLNDSVTGNASGSYTFNTWEAEENICHNFELLGEALSEFGREASYLLERGAEACDVTIRCYLLAQCLEEVLNELEEEGEEEEIIY